MDIKQSTIDEVARVAREQERKEIVVEKEVEEKEGCCCSEDEGLACSDCPPK